MSEQSGSKKSYGTVTPYQPAVSLIGRLTADPVLRYTPAGIAVFVASVVVSRRFNKGTQDAPDWQEKVSFFKATTWREVAERLNGRGLTKGDMVIVTYHPADLQAQAFLGADGKPRASLEISNCELHVLAMSGTNGATAEAAEGPLPTDEVPF